MKRYSKIYITITVPLFLFFAMGVAAQSSFTIDFLNLAKLVDRTAFLPLSKSNIDKAWDKINEINPPKFPVKIGIIDSGIDTLGDRHPEFRNINLGNTPINAMVDSTKGDVPGSSDGHGTQVSGIIGANNISFPDPTKYIRPQMNGILSGVHGLNYILEVRKPTILGLLSMNSFSVASQAEKILEEQVDIVNMSIGGTIPVLSTLGEIKFLAFEGIYSRVFNKGVNTLFVVAAGQEFLGLFGVDANLVAPAFLSRTFNNVITVGATNLDDTRMDASNFGGAVNIAAPGLPIYAPAPRGKGNFPRDTVNFHLDVQQNYDNSFGGTSASAPMVTGVAGLIKAINPNLSPAQIKQILISTADPIQTDKPIGGRLNAFKAVCDPLVLNCVPTPPPQLPIWPMLQKNAQRTGLADVSGPPFATSTQVTLKWQRTLDLPSDFPPVVGSQAVYVGVGSNLIAFDKTNGNQLWQSNIPDFAVNGALGPDGTIYVCGLKNNNQQSVLTAINPVDGIIKWQFVVGVSRPCNPPAVGQNGIIYTTVPPPLNTQTAAVVAVNPDGTQKWRHEEGNVSTTPPALSNDESQVYVGFFNDLKAFNSLTGQILWTQSVFQFPFFITVDPTDRVLDQTLDGFITAFSKSGNFLWQSSIGASGAALYPQNKILLVGPSNFTFLNVVDGSFISNGFWPNNFQLASRFPIVDKDGLIYLPLAIFGSPSQVRLFAFDGSGTVRWTFDIPSNLNIIAIGGSALNNDGTFYLLAQGTLFKLGK